MTPSLHLPERGAISSWSKFFSHTVLRRNSWPLDLCIETQPADFSTPIHWNGPRRDAIKMDKESSSGQTERAIDSSRHALKGDVFRISRFRHQLVIYGTRRGRSWSKSAKIYVSVMVSDSYLHCFGYVSLPHWCYNDLVDNAVPKITYFTSIQSLK